MANQFDLCDGRSLNPALQWMNEPAEWNFDAAKTLEITAPPGADFFFDPAGGQSNNSAPFLYTTVSGNFEVTTRVEVDMKTVYDSGCLMVMADERNWAKLCFEYFEDHPTVISVVTKNVSDDCVSCKVNAGSHYLRITRMGDSFRFYHSDNGEHWSFVRYFALDCPKEINVGVVAQSPTGNGCRVAFDRLEITQ
jgi:uncharacterized protein